MSSNQDVPSRARSPRPAAWWIMLGAVLLLSAYLRFAGLGARSLWLDEFCTWHVSRMDFGESLRWEPELTVPPLYQSSLRLIAPGPRPPEWRLRLPAAVCGVLAVLAAYWLGRVMRSTTVGWALAGLVACNLLQIEYSQEARPYSMLVLGCTLSVALWYRLVTQPRRFDFWMYIAATVLTFYAHFLVVLMMLAQLCWWAVEWVRGPSGRRSLRPLCAWAITVALAVPLVARSLSYRSSVTSAIAWIDPPSWERTAGMLREVTYGWPWVVVIFALVMLVIAAAKVRLPFARAKREFDQEAKQSLAALRLLFIWLVCAWLGLLLVSWFVVPMTITRYALPAAIPALLLPLILADWLHRRAPLILAVVFVLGTAPDWITRSWNVPSGFRELTEYVREHVDPEDDALVLVIAHAEAPHWVEMQRLSLEYYPVGDRPVYELLLGDDGRPEDGAILEDPRRLYLVVFRCDPFPVILEGGRRPEKIEYGGTFYRQLLFTPYRLIRVAPLSQP